MKLTEYEKGFRDAMNSECVKCKRKRIYWRTMETKQWRAARKLAVIAEKSLEKFPPKERERRMKAMSKIKFRRDH